MERFIDYKRVDNCVNRKRGRLCLHILMQSDRREGNVFYIKDFELCSLNKQKKIISMKIKTITPVEYYAVNPRFGGLNAIL